MKAIYLDCFAGISGNMLLGALIDAGLPEEVLRNELAKLPVHGYELIVERVVKCGISAVYVDVKLTGHHHHEHHHSDGEGAQHHHHHRYLPDIIEIIEHSTLNDDVKAASKKVFMRLAEAEARVHGTTVDRIHFHEVGAVDSIIDIIGTCFGLNYLGITEIYASKLNVGSGFIKCDHGVMPVPAPATAELLQGIPYYSGDINKELVTPTGAAVLAALGTSFGAMPADFISNTIGYGAGTWDLEIPNTLRLHIGEIRSKAPVRGGSTVVVEANIDDLNPQVYAYVMDKLFAAGALDVWLTPIIMKKSRPATQLSVLIPDEVLTKVAGILLKETSTIGMRYYAVDRIMAERSFKTVTVPWGQAQVKISSYQGKVCNISPEYDDCKRLAAEHGIALKVVQQAVLAAALKE